jgi:c-di-GMP-binding flagellar brake protein YcgR
MATLTSETHRLTVAHDHNRDLPCCVVAVTIEEVLLHPLARVQFETGAHLSGMHLLFSHDGRPIALRGAVDAKGEDDLRFRVTDHAHMPRRRAPRLDARLPVRLRPEGSEATVEATTENISATGLLCAEAEGLQAGRPAEFELELPDAGTIAGTARVVRITTAGAALDLIDVEPVQRARIAEHVLDVKRADIRRQVAEVLARVDLAA